MIVYRNRRKLFYLSRRVNGKPTKIYCGSGLLAQMAEAEFEAQRRERKADAEGRAASRAWMLAADFPLDALCAGLELFMTASLLAEGYHRQDRHAWRKRRERRHTQTH